MTSFSFSTNPYILKTVIKLMTNIDYHGYFTVSENGLTGTCTNESTDIGMSFSTNAELTTFKNKTIMVLATPDISRFLKRVSKSDKLTLSDTKDEFVITSTRKKMSVVSKLRKLNSQLREIKFDDAYHSGVTVDTKNFFTGLMNIGDCDTVNIKQKGAGVVIEMCVDRIRQSVTKLGACGEHSSDTDGPQGQTNFESNYSLYNLLKLSDVQFVSPVLTLSFRDGYPLRITAPTNLGSIAIYIKSIK